MATFKMIGNRDINLGLINPTTMTVEQKTVLGEYLMDNLKRGKVFFSKSLEKPDGSVTAPHEYSVTLSDPEDPSRLCNYHFDLSHNIVYRPRMSDPTQARFEIFDKRLLAHGGTSKLWFSDGTLVPQLDSSVEYKNSKTRLLKEEQCRTPFKKNLIENETALMMHAGYFNSKAFVTNGVAAFTIYRFIPGEILYNVTCADKRLTFAELLEITINFLRAVDEQLHARGIIHRDLKLNNVLMGKNGDITIIDLNLGIFKATPVVAYTSGTPGYRPLEQVQIANAVNDEQSDAFALGRCLAYMWDLELKKINDELTDLANDSEYDTSEFAEINGTSEQKNKLFNVIKDMTVKDQKRRLSVYSALEICERMRLDDRLKVTGNDKLKAAIKSGYEQALSARMRLRTISRTSYNDTAGRVKACKEVIIESLAILKDNPKAYGEFITILGVNAFKNKTPQEVLGLLKGLEISAQTDDNFAKYKMQLLEAKTQKLLLAAKQRYNDQQREFFKELYLLLQDLKAALAKENKAITIDELCERQNKYTAKLIRLQNRFDKLNTFDSSITISSQGAEEQLSKFGLFNSSSIPSPKTVTRQSNPQTEQQKQNLLDYLRQFNLRGYCSSDAILMNLREEFKTLIDAHFPIFTVEKNMLAAINLLTLLNQSNTREVLIARVTNYIRDIRKMNVVELYDLAKNMELILQLRTGNISKPTITQGNVTPH